MKFACINPNWNFLHSIYFGCREHHLPIELGYAEALLRIRGHDTLVIDAKLFDLSLPEIRSLLSWFVPDFTIVITAPTYLFWRCPPPELREPQELICAIGDLSGIMIAAGPHGSVTPETTLRKLGVTAVIRGECEATLSKISDTDWVQIPSLYHTGKTESMPAMAALDKLPPIIWPKNYINKHVHHHHRFDVIPEGPSAEVEYSRGCPFKCTFCAKEFFRGPYRKRPLNIVLQELETLIEQGVRYFYFIDEIFMPDARLMGRLKELDVKYGIQTRIDLWKPEMLELLGASGCVSIEAGVESLSENGRRSLGKNSRLGNEELTERLIYAKRFVPFVQANLIRSRCDDKQIIQQWRNELRQHGIWANDPVPLFPYPGSPCYRALWGEPDSIAWERSHATYINEYSTMSELQDSAPLPLANLEFERINS